MMHGRRIAALQWLMIMLQWLMIMHQGHRRGLRTGWLSLVRSHPLLLAWPPRHRVLASLRSPRVTRPVAGWARGRLPPRVTTTADDACIPPPGIQTPPSLPLRSAIVLHSPEPPALCLYTSPTCSHSAGGAELAPPIWRP